MMIMFGVVKVSGGLGTGRETLLSIRRGGDVVGELAAIDGSPRSATVVACGHVVVRDVGQRAWQEFLDHWPRASRALNVTMSQKMRAATRRRLELGGCSAAVRVARLVVELVRQFGDETSEGYRLTVELSQSEIAAAASCADASVRQALADLRRQGILSTSYRGLVVHDLPALRGYAELDDDRESPASP